MITNSSTCYQKCYAVSGLSFSHKLEFNKMVIETTIATTVIVNNGLGLFL